MTTSRYDVVNDEGVLILSDAQFDHCVRYILSSPNGIERPRYIVGVGNNHIKYNPMRSEDIHVTLSKRERTDNSLFYGDSLYRLEITVDGGGILMPIPDVQMSDVDDEYAQSAQYSLTSIKQNCLGCGVRLRVSLSSVKGDDHIHLKLIYAEKHSDEYRVVLDAVLRRDKMIPEYKRARWIIKSRNVSRFYNLMGDASDAMTPSNN